MAIQRTRFHTARNSPPQQTVRQEIVEPVAGVNRSRPALNLNPGETPFSQNFIIEDRYIRPRDGLNFATAITSATTPIGFAAGTTRASQTYTQLLWSASSTLPKMLFSRTVLFDGTEAAWSGVSSLVVPSQRTDGFWSVAVLKGAVPGSESFPAVIAVNPFSAPGHIGISGNSFTTLTEFYSIDSYARYVVPFDDRTVLFHSGRSLAGSDISNHPTRVSWTGRGSLTSFAIGGFEDLVSMIGDGTGMVPDTDRLVLFSDQEVWAGRPRRDAYAFDFFELYHAAGLPRRFERTVQNTEAGIIWLGEGNQFYRLVGSQVRPFGNKVKDILRDELREPSLCWTQVLPDDHIYAFHYSDTTGEYPTKSLFLRTDTIGAGPGGDDGAWMLQDFGTNQLALGSETPGQVQGHVMFTKASVPVALSPLETDDDGTAIDCRWRSHAMRAERDAFTYEKLEECWLDYEYDSATTSRISLFHSTDNGATFTAVSSASLTSGQNSAFIPVDKPAARNTMFEVRLNDGTRPKLSRFQLALRSYTGRHSG